MGRLIYSAIASLDGFVADAEGNFDWAEPDEEVHRFINERQRSIGTYLFGRRMYEVMAVWDAFPGIADQPEHIREFASVFQEVDKIVYSTTLETVRTRRTRLERAFAPDVVKRMKAAAVDAISIGGPELAGHALRAGLVDECELFVNPVVVGGGRHWLPGDVRIGLELEEERRFESGVVYLRYSVVG
jgi:dihydrofolate reductase